MLQSIKQRTRLPRRRPDRQLVCGIVAAVAIIALPTAAVAESPPPPESPAPEATDLCVGLECNSPASGSYVPEAQSVAPAAAEFDELQVEKGSGFYEVPAPVYREGVQPKSVVYLAKPGEMAQMPASLKNLTVVQDLARSPGFNWERDGALIVDFGIAKLISAESGAAAARPRAKAASLDRCPSDRYFCIFYSTDFVGDPWALSGAVYTGSGWHDMGANIGESMANTRDGDSLLSDHSMGTGTRYCAQENSIDANFNNNAIGNDNASSWAMLPASDNRC